MTFLAGLTDTLCGKTGFESQGGLLGLLIPFVNPDATVQPY